MKKRNFLSVCFLLTLAVLLAGCAGRTETPTAPVTVPIPETVPAQETASQASPAPASSAPAQAEAALDYGPDPWSGTYFQAAPDIEAGPEVLDSLTMTLPEGVTQHRVSDRQFDFVKNGAQIGGFLLVDIPRDMLEGAARTREEFDALSDYLCRQVMPDIYPAEAHLNGGGKIRDTNYYLAVFLETGTRSGIWTQYMHRVYVGEQYCYDFWIDEGLWADSGFGITDSLSAEDIKPELNQAEFAWSNAD